jgi:hypothetical protein
VLLHPDAIAKHGTTTEGAGGIGGEDADRKAPGPHHRSQTVDYGAFARSRRAGDADKVGISKVRIDKAHYLRYLGSIPFHQGNQASQGPIAASKHCLNQLHQL